jgi:hypothetical protein
MDLGIWLAVLAILIALSLPVLIDRVKRPRLAIIPTSWSPSFPTAWSFATFAVYNRPRRLARLFSTDTAAGCRAFADVRKPNTQDFVLRGIQLGWSHKPQPLNTNPDGTTRFAPERTPERIWADLPAGDTGFEVAAAILHDDGTAYAFGVDSYAFDHRNPDWKLDRGSYDVDVRIEGGGVSAKRTLRLQFQSSKLNEFILEQPL